MFLVAYGCERHSVFFDSKANELTLLRTLDDGNNVEVTGQNLIAGSTYQWRVDALRANGNAIEGEVWNFTIGSNVATMMV